MKLDTWHEEKARVLLRLGGEIYLHLEKQARSAAADGRVERVRRALLQFREALELIPVKEDRAYRVGFESGRKERQQKARAEQRAKEAQIRADERARLARRLKK